jgi:hypothetical protein
MLAGGDMSTYVVYRDGEEFEVGWFGATLDRIRLFWNTCKKTDWRHYFEGNGPGEVTWKKFTGFKELPNELAYCAQWCITVKGGIRNPFGNYYYRNITEYEIDQVAEKGFSYHVRAKVFEQERILDLYADPNCTCRIGFHRRCPHHLTRKD